MLRIHFKDDGQDVLWWDIDDHGIVQACNMQEWIWKGTKVMMNKPIKKGRILSCEFTSGKVGTFIHEVEKVETRK